jgi:pimeloyl-ACP methyl ester carboxylesterase
VRVRVRVLLELARVAGWTAEKTPMTTSLLVDDRQATDGAGSDRLPEGKELAKARDQGARASSRVRVSHARIDGLPVRWLRAGDAPVLYVHGVPDSADLWRPFLERTGGIAVDLPGFGESGKPAGWPYSAAGYRQFLGRFLDELGIASVRVVAHDWGAVALLLGDRVERAVAIAALPFAADHRWPPIARAWRTPFAGELAMGFTSRRTLERVGGLRREHAEQVMQHFDHGTQRAILKLMRGATPDALAAAGRELGDLKAPLLVVWGAADRYLAPDCAQRLAAAAGGTTEVQIVDGAGHWPWLDRPQLVVDINIWLSAL